MPNNILSDDEKQILLLLARKAIQNRVENKSSIVINPDNYSSNLQKIRATFVTLTIDGRLRGCIGTLDAYQSLVEDVYEHAIAAAFDDYRFPAINKNELNKLKIEISVLSEPALLEYDDPIEITNKLRIGIDGVVITDGIRRATFLPQVWEKIPDVEDFMSQLCYKMGVPSEYWKENQLKIYTYQVEEFSEY